MRTSLAPSLFGFVAILAVCTASTAPAQNLRRVEESLRLEGADSSTDALPAPGADDTPTLGLGMDEEETPGGGIKVASVLPGGPAEKAGVRAGDVIVKANGKVVNTVDEFAEALAGAKIGDQATFTVRGAGTEKTVVATFASRAQPTAEPRPALPATGSDGLPPLNPRFSPPAAAPADAPAEVGGRPTLGISVADITDEARTRYRLPTRRGALVTNIRPEGPADRAGIPIGAAIVSVDTVRIDTADQLIDAIRTSAPGQEIEIAYYNEGEMTRKTVRLGSAGPPPTGIGPPSPRTNRIDLGPLPLDPAAAATRPAIPMAGDAAADVAALREEVESLREQLRTLQERLRAVESRLPAAPPAAEPADRAPVFAPPAP